MVRIIKITGITALILLIISAITVYIFIKTGAVEEYIKYKIEIKLSEFMNRDVQIQNIEGGLFNNIVLNKVRITSKKGAKDENTMIIEKIIMNFSVKDFIFSKGQVLFNLKDIQIKLPGNK
jgi:hypothetical protein